MTTWRERVRVCMFSQGLSLLNCALLCPSPESLKNMYGCEKMWKSSRSMNIWQAAVANLPFVMLKLSRCFACSMEDEGDNNLCIDTDSDTAEKDDTKCKIKWTKEEVSGDKVTQISVCALETSYVK